ncbi:hypothetical protein [Limnofasciculus baicalensis]|uniref:Uncharacterized protein n=1 Tax=Limnofasciculus baicalensis BBK-W-15 TaxID=2699891 RepID=A0AAE3GRB6_9CYAN|nr:hypothetical protein [Limnofasciculus baicalensis]MCP2727102.1 hypothetical protein [Limnofasciculus baicalensis BBK-W-15]
MKFFKLGLVESSEKVCKIIVLSFFRPNKCFPYELPLRLVYFLNNLKHNNLRSRSQIIVTAIRKSAGGIPDTLKCK